MWSSQPGNDQTEMRRLAGTLTKAADVLRDWDKLQQSNTALAHQLERTKQDLSDSAWAKKYHEITARYNHMQGKYAQLKQEKGQQKHRADILQQRIDRLEQQLAQERAPEH